MKTVKILVAFLVVALFQTNVQAQELKPVKDDRSFELSLDPSFLGDGAGFGLINGITYRQFLSNNTAFRMKMDLGYNSNTTITDQEKEYKSKTSNFNLHLKPGYEKHFAGTERLSPFVGAEALIGFNSENTKTELADGDAKTKSPSLNLGAGVFAGADFYVTKGLYLGAEFGYGFVYSNDMKSKTEAPGVDDVEIKRGSSFNMGSNVNAKFRIGWNF